MTQLKITNSTNSECQCELVGYCNRHNAVMTKSSWLLCQHGKLEELLNKRPSPRSKFNLAKNKDVESNLSSITSQIGDFLAEIIKRETGHDVPCGACKEEIKKLNTMNPEEVLAEKEALVNRIFDRSKDNAQKWTQKIAIRFAPSLVKIEIGNWIEEACNMELTVNQKKRIVVGEIEDVWSDHFIKYVSELVRGVEKGSLLPSGMRRIVATGGYESHVKRLLNEWVAEKRHRAEHPLWAIGLTTIPSRIESMEATLESVRSAGFAEPILFVDSPPCDLYNSLKLEVSFRRKNIKTYANWLLGAVELYTSQPDADFFAMFQDDFICCPNLRSYIEKTYPKDGYLNLFSFMKKNEEIIAESNQGWVKSDQQGKGGLALVFNNEAMVELLTQRHMYDRMWNERRRYSYMDGAVVSAMTKAGRFEYIHNPSLIQHTGIESSMGNGTWGSSDNKPHAKSFRPDFDPLSLLP